MFKLSLRSIIIIGVALLIAAPSYGKRGVSMRPDRVARRHAADLIKIDNALPRHRYNQPIRTTTVGSMRVAQGRFGTAVVFKDGSWGVASSGHVQIYSPKRSSLTPKGPKSILVGKENLRRAYIDGDRKPVRKGPPKGVTMRLFSSYKVKLLSTERTNLDGSTMSSSEVVNAIPNTPYRGKKFNTLTRNTPWRLVSHSSTSTQWSATNKTSQQRDKLGRWLSSGQRTGAVPRKESMDHGLR